MSINLIYVASPYSGDVEKNVEFTKQACRYVMEHGHAFFAPHLLYPQILDDRIAIDRASGIGMGLALLERCDELWAFGGHISAGMQLEIARAAGLGIPVKTVPALDCEPQILAFPSNSEQESGQQL